MPLVSQGWRLVGVPTGFSGKTFPALSLEQILNGVEMGKVIPIPCCSGVVRKTNNKALPSNWGIINQTIPCFPMCVTAKYIGRRGPSCFSSARPRPTSSGWQPRLLVCLPLFPQQTSFKCPTGRHQVSKHQATPGTRRLGPLSGNEFHPARLCQGSLACPENQALLLPPRLPLQLVYFQSAYHKHGCHWTPEVCLV